VTPALLHINGKGYSLSRKSILKSSDASILEKAALTAFPRGQPQQVTILVIDDQEDRDVVRLDQIAYTIDIPLSTKIPIQPQSQFRES